MTRKVYRLTNVFVARVTHPGHIRVCPAWVRLLESFKGRPTDALIKRLNSPKAASWRDEARFKINALSRRCGLSCVWHSSYPWCDRRCNAPFRLGEEDWWDLFKPEEVGVMKHRFAAYCDMFGLTEIVKE